MAAFALAYLLGHGVAIVWLPGEPRIASFPFLIAAPLLAAAACALQALSSPTRSEWHAVALGMVLWAGGMATSMYQEVVVGAIDSTPAIGMLLFVLYGVPLVYALASRDHDIRSIRLVDGFLALTLGMLFAVHTFSSATWSGADEAGTARLRLMFDIENAFILAFALLRWRTADTVLRCKMFRALSLFSLVYAAVAAYINHIDTSRYGQLIDLAIDVPFLLLAVLALRIDDTQPSARPSGPLARVLAVASPLLLPIALLIVSGFIARVHLGLAIGGFAVTTLGYGFRSLLVQLHATRERERLDALTRIDALTGLTNRRHFDGALSAEWSRARRSGSQLSLLLLDIDHFKQLNDLKGHPAGDACLREVAQALKNCLHRGGDTVSRYGGEEFSVILPATSASEAVHVAELMRQTIHGLAIPSPAPAGHVTISVGVCSMAEIVGEDPSILVHAADSALYSAKRQGRDRVVHCASNQSAVP